jgi:hypothetical protein
LRHPSSNIDGLAIDNCGTVPEEVCNDTNQFFPDSSITKALHDLGVGHAVIGFLDVQEGGVELAVGTVSGASSTWVVVLLGASEEENQVVAGSLRPESSLAIGETHRAIIDLLEDLLFHALGQELGHHRLECNRTIAPRV